jgi:hypothetical protein
MIYKKLINDSFISTLEEKNKIKILVQNYYTVNFEYYDLDILVNVLDKHIICISDKFNYIKISVSKIYC